ncbi:hypothetical protein AVEN_22109-1 [Araneus ventricosus]|uniref:Uncharacterized protein n=1 Tax=Araneus ventricosus TaxID=182803 RepID=A0A4Y2VPC3_ARAVE|nr:hypothetical protein AVEN_22109-1 [Araneus ventricosus]
MPKRTLITQEEKALPGLKPMKEGPTHLLAVIKEKANIFGRVLTCCTLDHTQGIKHPPVGVERKFRERGASSDVVLAIWLSRPAPGVCSLCRSTGRRGYRCANS